MSFITFLWKGPAHPSFDHLQEDYLLKNVPIKRRSDDNFSFDFSAYEKAKAMWNRFSKLSYATGIGCVSLSVGLVGWTGWKIISTRSLFQTTHLVRLVGAVFFACILPRTYLAVRELSSSFHFLESHKCSSIYRNNIQHFRMGVLREYNFLSERLNPELQNRVSELFTEEEKEQLFRNLFNSHPEKIDNFTLLLSPNSSLYNLVQAYQIFRTTNHVQHTHEETEQIYRDWVKQNMQPSIDITLNSSQDKDMVALFSTCYTTEMESFWMPDKIGYNLALRAICQQIASKSVDDAVTYLKNNALDDFQSYLYKPGFRAQSKRIAEAMIEQNANASAWLNTNFKTFQK